MALSTASRKRSRRIAPVDVRAVAQITQARRRAAPWSNQYASLKKRVGERGQLGLVGTAHGVGVDDAPASAGSGRSHRGRAAGSGNSRKCSTVASPPQTTRTSATRRQRRDDRGRRGREHEVVRDANVGARRDRERSRCADRAGPPWSSRWRGDDSRTMLTLPASSDEHPAVDEHRVDVRRRDVEDQARAAPSDRPARSWPRTTRAQRARSTPGAASSRARSSCGIARRARPRRAARATAPRRTRSSRRRTAAPAASACASSPRRLVDRPGLAARRRRGRQRTRQARSTHGCRCSRASRPSGRGPITVNALPIRPHGQSSTPWTTPRSSVRSAWPGIAARQQAQRPRPRPARRRGAAPTSIGSRTITSAKFGGWKKPAGHSKKTLPDLLDHAVEVVDARRGRTAPRSSALNAVVRDRQRRRASSSRRCGRGSPARGRRRRLAQPLVEVLPDHEREPEDEQVLASVLGEPRAQAARRRRACRRRARRGGRGRSSSSRGCPAPRALRLPCGPA